MSGGTFDYLQFRLGEVADRIQKEIDNNNTKYEWEDDPVFSKLTNRYAGLGIARHFYELGLKGRKED